MILGEHHQVLTVKYFNDVMGVFHADNLSIPYEEGTVSTLVLGGLIIINVEVDNKYKVHIGSRDSSQLILTTK